MRDYDTTHFYRAAIGFSNRLWPSDCDLISFAVKSTAAFSYPRRVSLSLIGTASIITKEAGAVGQFRGHSSLAIFATDV